MKKEYTAALQLHFYGHENVPRDEDFRFAFRAVKVVAAGDGVLSDVERKTLTARMCAIGAPEAVVEDVLAWNERGVTPKALLEKVDIPPEARPGTGAWIVYEALSVAIADGLAPGEIDAMREVASTMGVPPEVVGGIIEVCHQERAVRERRLAVIYSAIDSREFRFRHS